MAVDPRTLSLQQLMGIRKQVKTELDHLSDSFQKLKAAQAKFVDCGYSVKQASAPENEDRELLVPLTASLYVPGKMVDTQRFLVDVGTDFHVEKTAQEAISFFDQKVEQLNKNLVDLDAIVQEKMSLMLTLDETVKQKVSEAQKMQQEEIKGKTQT